MTLFQHLSVVGFKNKLLVTKRLVSVQNADIAQTVTTLKKKKKATWRKAITFCVSPTSFKQTSVRTEENGILRNKMKN